MAIVFRNLAKIIMIVQTDILALEEGVEITVLSLDVQQTLSAKAEIVSLSPVKAITIVQPDSSVLEEYVLIDVLLLHAQLIQIVKVDNVFQDVAHLMLIVDLIKDVMLVVVLTLFLLLLHSVLLLQNQMLFIVQLDQPKKNVNPLYIFDHLTHWSVVLHLMEKKLIFHEDVKHVRTPLFNFICRLHVILLHLYVKLESNVLVMNVLDSVRITMIARSIGKDVYSTSVLISVPY